MSPNRTKHLGVAERQVAIKMNEKHRVLAAAVVDELRKNKQLNDELVSFLQAMYPTASRDVVRTQKTKRMMNDPGLRTASERQKKVNISKNAYDAEEGGSLSGARLENITLSGKEEHSPQAEAVR